MLNDILKLNGIVKGKKRVGRGIGSGKGGHTTGRGQKGQKARSGNRKPGLDFEGGQVPLYKRLPRIDGFKVYGKSKPAIINLSDLNAFKEGVEVTPEMLVAAKRIAKLTKWGVKVLGNGKLEKKLTLKGFLFSESAKKKVDESGSEIIK